MQITPLSTCSGRVSVWVGWTATSGAASGLVSAPSSAGTAHLHARDHLVWWRDRAVAPAGGHHGVALVHDGASADAGPRRCLLMPTTAGRPRPSRATCRACRPRPVSGSSRTSAHVRRLGLEPPSVLGSTWRRSSHRAVGRPARVGAVAVDAAQAARHRTRWCARGPRRHPRLAITATPTYPAEEPRPSRAGPQASCTKVLGDRRIQTCRP